MRNYASRKFAFAAEQNDSAFYAMFSNAFIMQSLAAIIPLMAFVLFIFVCGHLALNVIISVILGVIIFIVRDILEPVSRTR